MMDAWITFARTGNPATEALPAWCVYGRPSRADVFDEAVGCRCAGSRSFRLSVIAIGNAEQAVSPGAGPRPLRSLGPPQVNGGVRQAMEESALDQETVSRAACDAALLLTEAIRELTIPQHLVACFKRLEDAHHVSETYAAAVRRLAMAATVIGIYRVG